MTPTWRLINTGHDSPCRNMAIDEALLLFFSRERIPLLRLYGWSESAYTLGRYQDAGRFLGMGISGGLAVIRRMTGGGALLHGDEITYSLVCSPEEFASAHRVIGNSYKTICSFLLCAYRRMGLDAGFACDLLTSERFDDPSILCCQSHAKYDILVNGRKAGGNAQKRTRDALFQHGSIPLGLFGFRPGQAEGFAQLGRVLADSFRDTFGVKLEEEGLSACELQTASVLESRKYSADGWNLHCIENGHEACERWMLPI